MGFLARDALIEQAEDQARLVADEIFPPQRPQREEEPQELLDARRTTGTELQELFKQEYPDY